MIRYGTVCLSKEENVLKKYSKTLLLFDTFQNSEHFPHSLGKNIHLYREFID